MLRLLEYNPKASVIHNLDPRTKIYLSGAFITITLLIENLTLLLMVCVLSLLLVWRAHIISDVLKVLRGFIYFMTLIFLLDAMLFSLGFALTMIIKFVTIILSFLLLLVTTSPDELLQIMECLRLPMEAVMAFSIALRYVPIMIREAELIFDAQKSRGVDFRKGGIIEKLKGYAYLLMPLIAVSTRKAMSMAESMEARGFGAKSRRTSLKELKMSKEDYVVSIAISLILITMLLFDVYFGLPPWVTLKLN